MNALTYQFAEILGDVFAVSMSSLDKTSFLLGTIEQANILAKVNFLR